MADTSSDSGCGWVYAVRAGSDVKLGLTTNSCVFTYLHKNYSRTYSSWHAVQLLYVDDCRHAERALLYLLKKYVQHTRHEIVQCCDEAIVAAFRKVSIFFHDDPDRVAADMDEATQAWQQRQQAKIDSK